MWAAGIVRNLAIDLSMQEAVREQGGVIELLIAMLAAGIDSKSTTQAAAALSNLSIECAATYTNPHRARPYPASMLRTAPGGHGAPMSSAEVC